MSDRSVSVVRSVEEIGEGPLRNLVEQGTGGSFFHRYDWLRAVEDGLPWQPRHVVVRKGENPVGFLPTFGRRLSLPHDAAERVAEAADIESLVPPPPGYGGPVATGDEEAIVGELLDGVSSIDGSNAIFHRIQSYDVGSIRYGRPLETRGYEPRIDQCAFVLPLDSDWETLLDRMDSGRRKAMRRSAEQDAEVTIESIADDLPATYEMYAANMGRVGATTRPRSFFEAVADHLPDRVLVGRATVDGREVGRYVFMLDDEQDVLHHWLSAIPDSDDFDAYPSELLHRRAIQWGLEEGYDRYSFGPTAPDLSDSVFRFKEQYGGRPVPLVRWEKGTLPVAWQAYKVGRSWYRGSQMES
ncbi:GNAT family N-acetyltransferase [Salinarchaeum laminariae]|uniref:GNAT family N-acetyltransferase n=1 Tax=Salinarchaeum laminariae TaxID=869888 RepID=UPI0020BDCEDD|nr:GNAT family N-acetyltransferase [Salinarchaeum laminariae]